MITFPMIPVVEINTFLLIFVGIGAGIISGFTGVGGAFVMTPALVILGFPANFAVGTSLTWVVGNSTMAALGHRNLGNVDMKLGLVVLVAATSGMEVGVRILNWARNAGSADEVVLAIFICVLLIIGVRTLVEGITRKRELDKMLARKEELPPAMRATTLSRKLQSISMPPMLCFAKSGVTISLWIILAIGFFSGILSGFIGTGGGFIMVPSLVYLVGLPSFMAVGTNVFQMVFSSAYGSIRHGMSGNVIIFAAFIMLVASSIGVWFGVLVTSYVRGVSVRIILGMLSILVAVGTTLELLSILLGEATTRTDIWSSAVTFGGMGLAVIMILALFIVALRYQSGQRKPTWVESLVSKEN